MSTGTGVNLVPRTYRDARERVRHRNAWLVICPFLALIVAAGWVSQQIGSSALSRLTDDVDALRLQRGEVQRKLVAIAAERTSLQAELEAVAMAHRPQPWAGRLVALARNAPDQVQLSSLYIAAIEVARQGSGAGGAQHTEAPQQELRMLGYAMSHEDLLRFFDALQALPGVVRVDLVRAREEPYRSGKAVGFELRCITSEGSS